MNGDNGQFDVALASRGIGADGFGGAVATAAPLTRLEPDYAADTAEADRESLAGDELYRRGQFAAALPHYAAAVRHAPRSAIHHFRLGCCAMSAGNRDLALGHLQESVRLNPNDAGAQEALGQLFHELGSIEPALNHSAAAVAIAPDNPHFAVSRALVLEANRQSDAAREIVAPLMHQKFQSPRLALLCSRLARSPDHVSAALEMIQRLLSERKPAWRIEEISLHFAGADLLDKLGRYDEAFAHAKQANSLHPAQYDPTYTEQAVDAQIHYFSRQKLRSLPRAMNASDRPIFIVGMPRSGTSLTEQILASHPQVHGGGELEWLFGVANQATQQLSRKGIGYPNLLDQLSMSRADELADLYLRPLTQLNPSAKRVTDKLPLNFLHLGLIAILFPQARVIHCRRDPRDSCLSCYMTHFVAGNDFSYNLGWAGHFYRQYERLMAHWKSVLELPILDVTYEQLVSEPESQSRRLLEFAGLPWDEHCLRSHENARYVATASNEQVRRPIYTSSVQRWRHYEKHLGPLMVGLGWG